MFPAARFYCAAAIFALLASFLLFTTTVKAVSCQDNPPGNNPAAGYKWVASCGGPTCQVNSSCAVNEAIQPQSLKEQTNQCYGFDDGAKCLQLQNIGGSVSTPAPAPPSPISCSSPSGGTITCDGNTQICAVAADGSPKCNPKSTTGSTTAPPANPLAKWDAHNQTSWSLSNLAGGGLCLLAGNDGPIGCPADEVQADKSVRTKIFSQVPGGGVLGGTTNVLASLYNAPPTSSTRYIAGLWQGMGIVQPAYAADVTGSGADIIQPILNLWQVVRNLSYLFFTVIFLAVGFMIMFRQKLNQQTVVSVQAAIPGLVIGLILVTFSYLIAALIIDSSFLGVQLVAQIFVQAGHNAFGNANDIQQIAQNSSVFNLFGTSATRMDPGEIINMVTATAYNSGGAVFTITTVITAIVGGIIGTMLVPGVGTLVGAGVGAAAGPLIIGALLPLVLIIALFIQMLRLLFSLIDAYIQLLAMTVMGPFIILYSALPGKNGSLSFWWKRLLANSLVFPAVFMVFMFAGLILGTDTKQWLASPPLFGGLQVVLIKIILAYGIILGSPAVPGMVREAFGVKPIQGIPQAAMSGFMAGVNVLQTGATQGYQRIWRGNPAKEGVAAGMSNGPLARRFSSNRGLLRPSTP